MKELLNISSQLSYRSMAIAMSVNTLPHMASTAKNCETLQKTLPNGQSLVTMPTKLKATFSDDIIVSAMDKFT